MKKNFLKKKLLIESRRRVANELNHAVTVMCLNQHLQDGWTIDKIFKVFEKKVQPHTYHEFDIADCSECLALKRKEKKKIEKAPPRKKKEFSVEENLAREVGRYRADQKTHVTLHNVQFVIAKPGQVPVICRASFHGRVTFANFSIVDGGIVAEVHVALQPRENLSFADVAPFKTPNGLQMSKSAKGLCYVRLNYAQLQSDLCILGSRCKENKCRVDCEKHMLQPLEMSHDVPVALKRVVKMK